MLPNLLQLISPFRPTSHGSMVHNRRLSDRELLEALQDLGIGNGRHPGESLTINPVGGGKGL